MKLLPRRASSSRPLVAILLVLALGLFGTSCTLSENDQYRVTTGTSLYVTIKGRYSAALSLIGVVCNYDAGCVKQKVHDSVTIEGTGAAQFWEAVDYHSDELAARMHDIVDNGGSVNTGGPCIQMWHAFLGGNAGWNYVPRNYDSCSD